MIVAIIPAKGYSKGIEKKNLLEVGGKSLVQRAVESALIPDIDIVFVSTDSTHIIQEINFRDYPNVEVLNRPSCLTIDEVQVDEVVLFTLRQIQHRHPSWDIDAIVVLQPTSPFRDKKSVQEAVDMYLDMNQDIGSVFRQEPAYTIASVCEAHGHPYREQGGMIVPIGHIPRNRLGRQQALDNDNGVVLENGAIFVVSAERLSKERSFRLEPMMPSYMAGIDSIEIDDPYDYDLTLFVQGWRDEQDESNS